MKPKVIYDLSDFYRARNGWVYFLISKDKRYMKIGRTNAELAERIKATNLRRSFKDNQFSLLLAYNDANLENKFLRFFDNYRARYNWHEPNSRQDVLTYEELWKVATTYTRNKHGCYKKQYVIWAIHQYAQTTRNEFCKIPPKKLPTKLKMLIEKELGIIS
tara:strand:- start:11588 stop:12070 length:483 start_codon:yes stop_codon:yes gene_type:complete